MPSPPPTPGRFAAYQTALKAISARTGTPLSSLVVSFGILHELTAVLPIVGLFYASRSFGVGEQLVNAVTTASSSQKDSADQGNKPNWIAERGQVWIEEGEQWAVRIGRRYGWFGFEKRTKDSYSEAMYEEDVRAVRGHLAGDIANVVVAYASTKALLPLRIGASIYLTPGFARAVVDPCKRLILQPFRRRNRYLIDRRIPFVDDWSKSKSCITNSITSTCKRSLTTLQHATMGKLHLKRTPEEEAERQLRKRRKKEKREGKKSRYHSAQEPSPPRRKWASDDDDDATDVYGPQPPSTSESNGGVKDAHVHPFQPDYDEIRARLEEEQFREKMFSAFDEDERLDSLEANFNDYSHIPDRWQDNRTGPRRRLNVDEDEFLQMNPQHMDDEEYAEWVRLGMYRKTHRDEYEEKQKEKARKKERKEKEKAAKEESARLEKELDIERSRRRQEKESLHLQAAKELYESKWAALLRREGGGDEELGFEDIPWPLLAAYPKAKKQKRRDAGESPAINLQDEFTADAVAKFVLASSDVSEKGRKEKLRDTMLRFHPDKFEGRIMVRVRAVDKDRVREAVGQVARLLNDLMGDK